MFYDQSLLAKSPVVHREFIWMAEHSKGAPLLEFDMSTKQEHNFNEINRNDLLRFGFIGHNTRLFFESNGIFRLNGNMYEIIYKTNDFEYYMTGHYKHYNDIIMYRDAESSIDVRRKDGRTTTNITQYNFGYKQYLNINGVDFHFKAICKIPFNQPVHFYLRFVANKDLDGIVQIKKNGKIIDEINAPLRVNMGGELNWIIQ